MSTADFYDTEIFRRAQRRWRIGDLENHALAEGIEYANKPPIQAIPQAMSVSFLAVGANRFLSTAQTGEEVDQS